MAASREGLPEHILVYNAGAAEANGIYSMIPDRKHNNAPIYCHGSGNTISREKATGKYGFVLGKPPHILYASETSIPDPCNKEVKWVAFEGAAPIPIIKKTSKRLQSWGSLYIQSKRNNNKWKKRWVVLEGLDFAVYRATRHPLWLLLSTISNSSKSKPKRYALKDCTGLEQVGTETVRLNKKIFTFKLEFTCGTSLRPFELLCGCVSQDSYFRWIASIKELLNLSNSRDRFSTVNPMLNKSTIQRWKSVDNKSGNNMKTSGTMPKRGQSLEKSEHVTFAATQTQKNATFSNAKQSSKNSTHSYPLHILRQTISSPDPGGSTDASSDDEEEKVEDSIEFIVQKSTSQAKKSNAEPMKINSLVKKSNAEPMKTNSLVKKNNAKPMKGHETIKENNKTLDIKSANDETQWNKVTSCKSTKSLETFTVKYTEKESNVSYTSAETNDNHKMKDTAKESTNYALQLEGDTSQIKYHFNNVDGDDSFEVLPPTGNSVSERNQTFFERLKSQKAEKERKKEESEKQLLETLSEEQRKEHLQKKLDNKKHQELKDKMLKVSMNGVVERDICWVKDIVEKSV